MKTVWRNLALVAVAALGAAAIMDPAFAEEAREDSGEGPRSCCEQG